MPYVIAEPCIGVKDQACVEVCPMDAIHGSTTSPQMYIDPDSCTSCGACDPECPVEANFADIHLPSRWKHSIEVNAEFFR